jgi:hypothetical protein
MHFPRKASSTFIYQGLNSYIPFKPRTEALFTVDLLDFLQKRSTYRYPRYTFERAC